MIVKDGVVIYDHNVTLGSEYSTGKDFTDPTTRTDNATYFDVPVPQPFVGGWYAYDAINGFSLTANGLTGYKELLIKQLKNKASEVEFAGILVNEKPVKTSFESQQYVSGMYNTVQLDVNKIIDFVYADSTWESLDKTAVETLAAAVSVHVEACFTQRKALQIDIMAATDLDSIKTVEATIGTGWPETLEVEVGI